MFIVIPPIKRAKYVLNDDYCPCVLLCSHVAELEKAEPTVIGFGDMILCERACLMHPGTAIKVWHIILDIQKITMAIFLIFRS